jgi:hypothetical protein
VSTAALFRVGTAKAKITPSSEMGPVYRAGYKMGEAEQLRETIDDLFVRCLTIEKGDTRVVILSLDLVGLFRDFTVDLAKRLLSGIKVEELLVATTHTHSGPDSMGLWGPSLEVSGFNEKYGEYLLQVSAESVRNALDSAVPADAYFGFKEINLGVGNYRQADDLNLDLWCLLFKNGNEVVGSLVSYPAQPELTPRHDDRISAGYPGEACKMLEKELGGTALFLLGVCGGMEPAGCEKGYVEAHQYGQKLAEAVLQLSADAEPVHGDNLSIRMHEIEFPIENPGFQMMMETGMIRTSQRPPNGTTTVSKVSLGEVTILTIPGEAFPGIVSGIGEKGRTLFVSQVNDSLGYFIPPDQFNPEPRGWEEGQHFTGHELESLGPSSGEILRRELKKAFAC